MSVGGAAGGAAVAAAAAQARRRRQRLEEEQMTDYGLDDLNGWEFKILRATGARFRDPISMRRILEEEAEAGWELVEKFDNQRIRLKRETSWRENDHKLAGDPYRVWVGMSPNAIGLIVVGVMVAVIAAGAVFAAALG